MLLPLSDSDTAFINHRDQYATMKAPSPTACLCCALIVILVSCGCITHTGDGTGFMENVNRSQEYYDNRVAAEPDNAEAWCIRGMYYNNYHNQYAEAMESCNKALELDPEYGLAWYLKGVILTNMNMTDEAAACFENATRYDPELARNLPFVAENT